MKRPLSHANAVLSVVGQTAIVVASAAALSFCMLAGTGVVTRSHVHSCASFSFALAALNVLVVVVWQPCPRPLLSAALASVINSELVYGGRAFSSAWQGAVGVFGSAGVAPSASFLHERLHEVLMLVTEAAGCVERCAGLWTGLEERARRR